MPRPRTANFRLLPFVLTLLMGLFTVATVQAQSLPGLAGMTQKDSSQQQDSSGTSGSGTSGTDAATDAAGTAGKAVGAASAAPDSATAAMAALLEVLQNEQARGELVDLLQKAGGGSAATSATAASGSGTGASTGTSSNSGTSSGTSSGTASGTAAAAGTATATASSDDGEINVAQKLAQTTAHTASAAIDAVMRAGHELAKLWSVGAQLFGPDRSVPLGQMLALAVTILATIVLHSIGAAAVRRRARRIRPGIAAGLRLRIRRALIIAGLRVVVVILVWILGQQVARLLTAALVESGSSSETGIDVAQSLYLNAFALFGLVRAVIALIAAPDADAEPAVGRLAPGAQTIVYRNLRSVAGTLIQGYMFVVPLSNIWLGYVAMRSVRTLVATLVAVLAFIAIRQVARALDMARGDRVLAPDDAVGAITDSAQMLWRKVWPPIAVLYVCYGWFMAVTRPRQVTEIVMAGSLLTIGALVLLLLALWLARSAAHMTAPLPEALTLVMPRLKPRADAIARVFGWFLAVVFVVLALHLSLAAWGIISLPKLVEDSKVQAVLWRIASALIITFGAGVLWALVASWIDHRLRDSLPGRNVSARMRTLLSLFRNAFTVALAILTTMIALSQIGINIAPLLAGAGVVGLAIGFGAQTAVQDIITGIFIQLEGAMNEGDVVTAGGLTGGVEKITIRSVHLRQLDGTLAVVPFSAVTTVANLTRDFSAHVAQIGVAYKEDIGKAKEAMQEAFRRLREDGYFDALVIDALEMHGVNSLGDSAVVIQARIRTLPGKQWEVGRKYSELVKYVMDERGIEIPFPHRTLYLPEGLQIAGRLGSRDSGPVSGAIPADADDADAPGHA